MMLSELSEQRLRTLTAREKWRIVADGVKDDGRTAEYALLLGSSPTNARERALAAAELYRAGRVRYVVPSGGVLWDTEAGRLSEAEYMARILRENGVPEDAIFLENAATTTRENMILGTLEINRRTRFRGEKSVIIVTSENHMKRSIALARALLPRFVEVSMYPSRPKKPLEELLASPAYVELLDKAIRLTRSLVEDGIVEDVAIPLPEYALR